MTLPVQVRVGAVLPQLLGTADAAGGIYEAEVGQGPLRCGCTFKKEVALLGIGSFVGDKQLKANLAIIGKR